MAAMQAGRGLQPNLSIKKNFVINEKPINLSTFKIF